jgi:hypothetical protein
MRGRGARKRAAKMMKWHDEAVARIVKNPEILVIPDLNSKSMIYKDEFPELKKKGQETGDLILLWKCSPREWEILVLEVTNSIFRPLKYELFKLEMSCRYFRTHWKEWFKKIGLNLPSDCSLWIRTATISYAGKAPWDKPFINQKRGVLYNPNFRERGENDEII